MVEARVDGSHQLDERVESLAFGPSLAGLHEGARQLLEERDLRNPHLEAAVRKSLELHKVRVSADRERADRSIVNAKIGAS